MTADSTPGPEFLRETLDGLLDRISAREPVPGGGSVAAIAVAMAAALAGMAARFSDAATPDCSPLAAQSDALRDRVASLARADALAYQEVLSALRLPKEPEHGDRIRSALSAASDVPLAVAETAAAVAELADRLARRGNPNLRGDAIAGALLAEAGARAAAVLVRINLDGTSDERIARADELAATATRAARRAVEAAG